ncbi:hypothetical protein EMCRGX_G016141 [Ephydatia muelleri]
MLIHHCWVWERDIMAQGELTEIQAQIVLELQKIKLTLRDINEEISQLATLTASDAEVATKQSMALKSMDTWYNLFSRVPNGKNRTDQ